MADAEKKIWDFLKGKGLNDYAAAGVMGNLYAESGLNSNNLQNTYEKKLGLTDAQYTAAVDNGSYKNFVHDSAGYGLAQWTYYTRKEQLLNFAKVAGASIGDLTMQLNFLWKELQGYKSVMQILNSAKSIKAASNAILLQFERPADQSEAVQNKRASYGQQYYDKYAAKQDKTESEVKTVGKTISAGFISDVINGIKVDSSLPCNSGNYNTCSSRSVDDVVMHYTGNSKDAAVNNCKYFQTGGRNASAHFFVDDANIRQSVKLKDKAWHCGTSGTYYHASCRNANSIGIEMCCTAGNYKVSEKTKENAAHLCAHLCKMLGITAAGVDAHVLRHYDVTHKQCPAQMAGANNAEWAAFKQMVKYILNGAAAGSKPAESKPQAAQPAGDFKVRVSIDDLNIRKGAGTNYAKTGKYTGKGVFTIVEVKSGDGSTAGWGKLKSGAGWISLDYATRV